MENISQNFFYRTAGARVLLIYATARSDLGLAVRRFVTTDNRCQNVIEELTWDGRAEAQRGRETCCF